MNFGKPIGGFYDRQNLESMASPEADLTGPSAATVMQQHSRLPVTNRMDFNARGGMTRTALQAVQQYQVSTAFKQKLKMFEELLAQSEGGAEKAINDAVNTYGEEIRSWLPDPSLFRDEKTGAFVPMKYYQHFAVGLKEYKKTLMESDKMEATAAKNIADMSMKMTDIGLKQEQIGIDKQQLEFNKQKLTVEGEQFKTKEKNDKISTYQNQIKEFEKELNDIETKLTDPMINMKDPATGKPMNDASGLFQRKKKIQRVIENYKAEIEDLAQGGDGNVPDIGDEAYDFAEKIEEEAGKLVEQYPAKGSTQIAPIGKPMHSPQKTESADVNHKANRLSEYAKAKGVPFESEDIKRAMATGYTLPAIIQTIIIEAQKKRQ